VNGSKVMPAFGDVLQPTELDDLVAYLRSCKDKPIK
jgi:mono/diheme cytochrome c family protein